MRIISRFANALCLPVIWKLKLSKSVFYKICCPKFFDENFFRKIQTFFSTWNVFPINLLETSNWLCSHCVMRTRAALMQKMLIYELHKFSIRFSSRQRKEKKITSELVINGLYFWMAALNPLKSIFFLSARISIVNLLLNYYSFML